MIFSRFKSVRGRLLAVMALILVPIAAISIILAITTYRSVQRGIEASQIEITSNYAVRVRVWFRGTLRMLMAAEATLQPQARDGGGCRVAADSLRASAVGIQALFMRTSGGVDCSTSGLPDLTDEVLSTLLRAQSARPANVAWGGIGPGTSRYDAIMIGPRQHLLVYVKTGSASEALLVIDPNLLDAIFDVGSFAAGGIVALVNRGQTVIVARGAREADRSWLPAAEEVPHALTRAERPDLSGHTHAFASQIVAEPDLYVLARFDNAAANAAFAQFMVLCLTLLLMLFVLFGTYVWAIEGNVLRWLKVIDLAARARREGRSEQVAMAEAMPSDVKLLATSFNDMVADADKREMALRASFEANEFLMRELHHRVKNSLQVIQSYLALSRRLNKRSDDRHLIETEAKVQVLSTAYRLALLEGAMRPVPLGEFVREILDNLSNALKLKTQSVDVHVETNAGLVVDRTIPIGLALVEAVAAALAADQARTINVWVRDQGDGSIEIAVTSDGKLDDETPPPKIMAGLALQLGAVVLARDPGFALKWQFAA